MFVKSAVKTVVLFWKFMFMKQKCDNERFSCKLFQPTMRGAAFVAKDGVSRDEVHGEIDDNEKIVNDNG